MNNPPEKVFDTDELRSAATRRLQRRSTATGTIAIPAAPGMVDHYVSMLMKLFASLGSAFNTEQEAHLRSVLHSQLVEAYKSSQRSEIVITYDKPFGMVLNYQVQPTWKSIESTYETWVATREPPLFGTEPDAKVWALANEAADPADYPVLDIGAGTGRNALALARRGHPVDVIEVTASFANAIVNTAAEQQLDVRVLQRDMFTTTADLRDDYQLILLSAVVPEFRTVEHLRKMFELADAHLGPGGRLVFNTFMYRSDLALDDATREVSEQMISTLFSWDEMTSATEGLELQLVGDDSVFDYEKENLPDGAWPPTGSYAGWVAGQDVYDLPREKCPNELRWLVFQKPAAAVEEPTSPIEEPPQVEEIVEPVAAPTATEVRQPEPKAPVQKPRRFKFFRK